MTTDSLKSLQVSRHFDAAPERVFDAWTDPPSLHHWLFSDPGRDKSYVADVDARVGGAYKITAVKEDGSDWLATGEYLELDRPRRLAFSLGMTDFGSNSFRIVIDIVPDGAGCTLTLTQEGFPDGAEEAIKEGWMGMLDILAGILG